MSDGITDMSISQEALKEYLYQSMEYWGARYELQYYDYSENEWTVPLLLGEKEIERLSSDLSIKKIRLTFSL